MEAKTAVRYIQDQNGELNIDECGQWVRFEDYTSLRQENEKLNKLKFPHQPNQIHKSMILDLEAKLLAKEEQIKGLREALEKMDLLVEEIIDQEGDYRFGLWKHWQTVQGRIMDESEARLSIIATKEDQEGI